MGERERGKWGGGRKECDRDVRKNLGREQHFRLEELSRPSTCASQRGWGEGRRSRGAHSPPSLLVSFLNHVYFTHTHKHTHMLVHICQIYIFIFLLAPILIFLCSFIALLSFILIFLPPWAGLSLSYFGPVSFLPFFPFCSTILALVCLGNSAFLCFSLPRLTDSDFGAHCKTMCAFLQQDPSPQHKGTKGLPAPPSRRGKRVRGAMHTRTPCRHEPEGQGVAGHEILSSPVLLPRPCMASALHRSTYFI